MISLCFRIDAPIFVTFITKDNKEFPHPHPYTHITKIMYTMYHITSSWAPLHKTMVTLQLMISLQSMVTIIDFLTLIGYRAVLLW